MSLVPVKLCGHQHCGFDYLFDGSLLVGGQLRGEYNYLMIYGGWIVKPKFSAPSCSTRHSSHVTRHMGAAADAAAAAAAAAEAAALGTAVAEEEYRR
jgi:hypothetical protein